MPTASPYQHVFRINKSESINNGNGTQLPLGKAKRNRMPLSCEACRVRKLKCDRQSPCSPCSKRGDVASASCIYSRRDKDGVQSPATNASSTRSEAQLRLQKLEEMVTDFMQSASTSSVSEVSLEPLMVNQSPKEATVSPESSSEQSGSISNGRLDTNGLERHYHGATHWTTILENIQDIRDLVESGPESVDAYASSRFPPDAVENVFANAQPLRIDDFLNALPSKATTDKLVSTYLTSEGIRAPHVHSRKFLREYRAFWNDPHSTSLLWISTLFSVLWMSLYLGPSSSDPTRSTACISYFTKAGQALVAGGYHKARPYAADATLLYALCSFYMSKQEDDSDCWLMLGIATRLAVKMGYHRDPKHLSDISPFEGEMRRRCFFLLDTFDVLLSNQYGLPAILQEEDCDTETPRNLLDDDFDEDCKVLPPSRPNTDATPMLYFCFKSRFAKAHKRASRHALALETTSYAETLKLDAELHANDADVPPSLQMTSLDELLLDQPWQTLRRMHIKFQYLRSLCVLHRKYLNQGRTNPQFAYSRKVCTDASLQLLKYQADIYIGSRPGGRFHDCMPMSSMLTQHHFLLAAMILCLDIYECYNENTLLSPEDLKAQATKYDALTMSHTVWMSRSNSSRDARRATNVVASILARVPRPDISTEAAGSLSEMQSRPPQILEDNAGLPDFKTSSGMNSSTKAVDPQSWNQQLVPEGIPVMPFNATDSVNMLFDGTENIDWDMLDQYFVDGSAGPDESSNWRMPESSRP